MTTGTNDLQESFENFFESALCGFITADAKGIIIRANKKFAGWIGYSTDELKGKRFSNYLAVGGKIYYETHLWPLLRMQGFFDEVVLELSGNAGQRLRVMVNAFESRDKNDQPNYIRFTILKASDRLQYEQNLQEATRLAEKELIKQKETVILREQLIAVLGHDLRNPLTAISMAVDVLTYSLGEHEANLLAILKKSTLRMSELVNNIMDFARTRLGEGIVLTKQNTTLKPLILQVINELQLAFPTREIIVLCDIMEPVFCDPHRIAQLLSNLLANALTHGSANTPVRIHAFHKDGNLEISVINYGVPIPADIHEYLFAPFTREPTKSSQNGLGLGLYISSEIARAHNGTINCTSTNEETCFTFSVHS